ncbi:membrane protein insertion efficiency factor YidD [Vibrio salinus]|uniref:membrane protein insertion efficiency factor YidD n=1 Tax=Vibrio salinus TaxID=2899784 RepID=UPI001E394028|nr:membrane protein insertion efficiency factor YidD [Vibrio salinus]MCE0495867.1 membrane protein insertion efficiency factor YidD [Vibrio salinus]
MLKHVSLRMISWYQSNGGSEFFFNIECNYEPSCSEYTRQCILKYGVIKGWMMGCQRIKRCSHTDLVEKIVDDVP